MLSFSGCKKTKTPMDLFDVIKSRDSVIIGVKDNIKPFAYVDENGNQAGFEIDIARKIAKALLGDENKIEFVTVQPSDKIMALNSGKVDMIIAVMTITPQRQSIIDFSKPYYTAGQTVMVNNDSEIKSISDLNGKRIGIIFGTTGDKGIKSVAPTTIINGFKTYDEAVAQLKNKTIDGIALDDTILLQYQMNDKNLRLLPQRYTKEPYGIAFRKGIESERVLQISNEVIDLMNSTGYLNELKAKWIK